MAPCKSAAVAVILSLGLVSPTAAVQSEVRSHRDAEIIGQEAFKGGAAKLGEALRLHMGQVKKAIWDELGLALEAPLTEDSVGAARELLHREADYLSAEDTCAGAVLHDFARSGLVPELAFQPFVELKLPMHTAPQALRLYRQPSPTEIQGVESEETIVRQDSQGRMVRTTRRCHGTKCVTKTQEMSAETQSPQKRKEMLVQDEEAGVAPNSKIAEEQEQEDVISGEMTSAANMVGPSLRVVARNMAKALEGVLDDSCLPPANTGEVSDGTSAKHVASGSLPSGDVKDVQLKATATPSSFGKAFKDFLSSITRSGLSSIANRLGSPFANVQSESLSTVTTVENGHTTHRVRHCKQGRCTTTTK